VHNRDALANPAALELFRDLPELRDESTAAAPEAPTAGREPTFPASDRAR
jgi:hypothetical protein